MPLKRYNDFTDRRTCTVTLPDPTRTSVAAWLGDLPLANTAYSFEALAATLESFNGRIGLPPALRFELAELIRPAVLVVAQRAEAHFMDSSLPYPAEAASYLERGLGLHCELQLAYALPCLNPAFAGAPGKGGGQLGQALYRAFQQAGLVLLWTTQLYQQPDGEYWTLLYRLYGIAEAQNLLHARFEDAGEPESCRSVEDAFKRCLLFQLADSRRLRQREMTQAYALLGELGGTAYVGGNVAYNGSPAEFAVSLESGRPPLRARPLIDSKMPGLRFLCTHDLVRRLIAPDGTKGGAAGNARLDKSVALRIARSLGAEGKRRSRRWPEFGHCHYVIGLQGVLSVLSDFAPREESTPPGARPPSAAPDFGPTGVSPEVSFIVGAAESREEPKVNAATDPLSPPRLSAEKIWHHEPASAGRVPTVEIEGKLVNSGPQGYCVVWPAAAGARAKVGELIGLRAEKALFIGAIRRLEFTGGAWRFGVELLTPSARVVELGERASMPKAKALLLPIEPVLRAAPELLAPPGSVRAGGLVDVHSEGEVTRYRVRELLEGTPSFVRFGLVLAEDKPEPR
jgi:hypothetical protein